MYFLFHPVFYTEITQLLSALTFKKFLQRQYRFGSQQLPRQKCGCDGRKRMWCGGVRICRQGWFLAVLQHLLPFHLVPFHLFKVVGRVRTEVQTQTPWSESMVPVLEQWEEWWDESGWWRCFSVLVSEQSWFFTSDGTNTAWKVVKCERLCFDETQLALAIP